MLVSDEARPLAELLDHERTAERLVEAGHTAETAAAFAALVARAARALCDDGIALDRPVHAFVVPGRIEILGKHTDYAGGRSLLAAIERGICIVAAARTDDRVAVIDAMDGDRAEFALSPGLDPRAGSWANYPMTVARRLARNFPEARTGADVAFASNLVRASGMSSSAALVTAVFLALAAVNRLERTERYRASIRSPEQLADYISAVENGRDYPGLPGDRGVGTDGGSEDHTAILCCRPGHLLQASFRPVRLERSVPLPAGHTFVVAFCGVHAEKTGAAMASYNRAAELTRIATEIWRAGTGRDDPHLAAALESTPASASAPDAALETRSGLDSGPNAAAAATNPATANAAHAATAATAFGVLDRLRALLERSAHPRATAAELIARIEQFAEESRIIIPAASDALARGDVAAFGELVDRSQHLAETRLGNQIEETIHLARTARELGAAAASAFGAGFGGSVWALVEDSIAPEFIVRWRTRFLERFPEHAPRFLAFATRPGPATVRIA